MTDQAQPGSAADAAVLVIRVWRDPGGDGPGLRARVTRRPDLSTDQETSTVVTSPEAVHQEVRSWLDTFLGQSGQV